MVSLSISISWLDFLPGGGLRSPGHWIFTQNINFVKDVTGRNKKYQKYQLWPYNEFIIPPSPEALPLHALIISLKTSGKIAKLENECTEFSNSEEFGFKLFNLSFNLDLKTSCALPPYYSLELAPISSTSHSILSRAPGSRILMICCVSRAKMYFKHWKINVSCSFALFFSIFWFSQFRWFSDRLTVNFNFLAGFPARGWSQIARAFEFSLKMRILLRT